MLKSALFIQKFWRTYVQYHHFKHIGNLIKELQECDQNYVMRSLGHKDF